MARPVCPGNERRGRQGGGLARAAGPTPCYLKQQAYKGERACSVEGWGWGREVGAGVPRSRAGWCQVPGSACGSPAGAFCHPSCLTPFIIPPAWAPHSLLTGNILPSLSIPPCSPPEQNVLELGSHAQPPLEPSISFTTNIPGSQGLCTWQPPLLALPLPPFPAAWLAPEDPFSPLYSWQPCWAWSTAILDASWAGSAYHSRGLCATNAAPHPPAMLAGKGERAACPLITCCWNRTCLSYK